MAYSVLPAKVASDTLTLANYNNIKDNFAAGVPDLFTTKGDLAVATGADAATRLAVGADDATLVADASQAGGLAWQIQPAARAYNSGAIDPAVDTWVTLALDSERYDTDGAHSTSSNTSRLTVPSGGGGIYSIGAAVQFDTGALAGLGGVFGLRLLLNGATVIAEQLLMQAPTVDVALTIHTEYALAATDYVEVQVWTSQDVNVNAAGNYSPELYFSWERRA